MNVDGPRMKGTAISVIGPHYKRHEMAIRIQLLDALIVGVGYINVSRCVHGHVARPTKFTRV